MGKNDFVSGSIMEFKVPKELGYAYCKVLDFRHIREFDGVLVKVYDLLVKAPIDDMKILAASDLTESTDIPCPYEKVRHLENTVVGSQYGIEIRTAMEFYRKNGWDIKSHFDLSELSNSNIYRMMINIPIYSTIPKDMRGKSLC